MAESIDNITYANNLDVTISDLPHNITKNVLKLYHFYKKDTNQTIEQKQKAYKHYEDALSIYNKKLEPFGGPAVLDKVFEKKEGGVFYFDKAHTKTTVNDLLNGKDNNIKLIGTYNIDKKYRTLLSGRIAIGFELCCIAGYIAVLALLFKSFEKTKKLMKFNIDEDDDTLAPVEKIYITGLLVLGVFMIIFARGVWYESLLQVILYFCLLGCLTISFNSRNLGYIQVFSVLFLLSVFVPDFVYRIIYRLYSGEPLEVDIKKQEQEKLNKENQDRLNNFKSSQAQKEIGRKQGKAKVEKEIADKAPDQKIKKKIEILVGEGAVPGLDARTISQAIVSTKVANPNFDLDNTYVNAFPIAGGTPALQAKNNKIQNTLGTSGLLLDVAEKSHTLGIAMIVESRAVAGAPTKVAHAQVEAAEKAVKASIAEFTEKTKTLNELNEKI